MLQRPSVGVHTALRCVDRLLDNHITTSVRVYTLAGHVLLVKVLEAKGSIFQSVADDFMSLSKQVVQATYVLVLRVFRVHVAFGKQANRVRYASVGVHHVDTSVMLVGAYLTPDDVAHLCFVWRIDNHIAKHQT